MGGRLGARQGNGAAIWTASQIASWGGYCPEYLPLETTTSRCPAERPTLARYGERRRLVGRFCNVRRHCDACIHHG